MPHPVCNASRKIATFAKSVQSNVLKLATTYSGGGGFVSKTSGHLQASSGLIFALSNASPYMLTRLRDRD
jgi:hypothetical protein